MSDDINNYVFLLPDPIRSDDQPPVSHIQRHPALFVPCFQPPTIPRSCLVVFRKDTLVCSVFSPTDS